MSDLGADCERDHSAARSDELSVAATQRADHPRWLNQRRNRMTVITTKGERLDVGESELQDTDLATVTGGMLAGLERYSVWQDPYANCTRDDLIHGRHNPCRLDM
jgi:hypothetical protein